MTYSPTGYWVTFTFRTWAGEALTGEHKDSRPILNWNADGRPVIADERGNLLTPGQYANAWLNAQEGDRRTLEAEVQPYPHTGR